MLFYLMHIQVCMQKKKITRKKNNDNYLTDQKFQPESYNRTLKLY